MIRFAMPVLIWASCASLSGCLSHMAAREDSGSLGIRWQEDFDVACRTAAASGRPILVVMVAGDLRDKC